MRLSTNLLSDTRPGGPSASDASRLACGVAGFSTLVSLSLAESLGTGSGDGDGGGGLGLGARGLRLL